MRGVDHNDLISADVQIPKGKSKRRQLSGDLSEVFGIEFDDTAQPVKTTKSKTSSKKNSSPLKISPPTKIEKSKPKTIRPTGKTVARLRKRFDMNLSQFAHMVGVSAKTISNWESQPERLTLRSESLAALTKVNMLDKTQAWEYL